MLFGSLKNARRQGRDFKLALHRLLPGLLNDSKGFYGVLYAFLVLLETRGHGIEGLGLLDVSRLVFV